jgi:hypothetical protein
MLRTKRKGNANSTAQFFMDEEEEEQAETRSNQCHGTDGNGKDGQSSDSVRSLIPEDPCTSSGWGGDQQLEQFLISDNNSQRTLKQHTANELGAKRPLKESQIKMDKAPRSVASSNSLMDKGSSSRGDDEMSALDENEVLTEGEVL